MAPLLDDSVIRNSEPGHLAEYFRSALSDAGSKVVSDHLLHAIELESVPPRVCSVWLDVCHDFAPLVDSLHQPHSMLVRKIAIKCFAKRLRTNVVGEAWSAVGGTKGLLELLSGMSVTEVKLFCKTVGGIATSTSAVAERQSLMTELVLCLADTTFGQTEYKNPDCRPLLRHYSHLLPACTSEMVKIWICNDSLPKVETDRLHRAHPTAFQSQCIDDMQSPERKELSFYPYADLFQSVPPLPADEPSLSASMIFSTTVLKRLHVDKDIWFTTDLLYNSIIVPLTRRLWTRRCRPMLCHEILGMVVACIQRYGKASNQTNFGNSRNLIYYVVRMWSRSPDLFEPILIALIQAEESRSSKEQLLTHLGSLMELVKHHLRHRLLELVLKHHQGFKIDILDDAALKADSWDWPLKLLFALPRSDGLALLQRLIKLIPAGDFLDCTSLTPLPTILRFDHRGDATLILLLLSRDEATGVEIADAAVEERKTKASTSRDQVDRAYWAKNTVLCAIASGSLQLFHDTLIWVRRYNRDALTVKDLYSNTVNSVEAIGLLRGFPMRPSISNTTLDEVRTNVSRGNSICKLLFETACMALREPSFAAHDWNAVLDLFRKLVEARLEAVNELQTALSADSEEIYEALWRDTLDTCLALEEAALEEGHERLGCNTQGGLLQRHYYSVIGHKHPQPATLRFIDELAQRRDELWKRYRPMVHPSVVALSNPWPTGLPLNSVFPFILLPETEPFSLPHISSRAEQVVFIDPAYALEAPPSDEQTQNAIGAFVDDYKFALRLWVNQLSDVVDRHQRAEQAWKHAIDRLRHEQMTIVESMRYWARVFGEAGVELNIIDIKVNELEVELPAGNDPLEPCVWDPDPLASRPGIAQRELSATCLDCMLNPGSPYDRISTGLRVMKPRTVAVEHLDIWRRRRTPKSREALVLAALLFLDARRSAGSRILARPFPDADNLRFPVLYLDEEFLDRKDQAESLALETLTSLGSDVPSSLVIELASSMLASSKQHKNPWVVEQDSIALLALVVSGDRPATALKLVTHLVLGRPDCSSWHRHVLNVGLLNGLSAKDAKSFIQDFSMEMQTLLEAQSERSTTLETKDQTSSKQPLVKITTVKMMAQILSDAEFVSQSFAVDTLANLLTNARHLDVRAAIIESLSHMLVVARDEELEVCILDVLEYHAIPIAAAINEHHPMSDVEWQQAEESGKLAEAYDVSTGEDLPPVLNAMLNVSSQLNQAGKKMLRETVLNRVLLPILQLSAFNNQRWLTLFLRQRNVSLTVDKLPALPVKPPFLVSLIWTHIELLPGSALETLAQFILMNLQPPASLEHINALVLGDSSLRHSNAGLHWLSLWNNKGNSALSLGSLKLSNLLREDWTEVYVPHGITRARIQHHWLYLAETVISQGSHAAGLRDSLISELKPPTRVVQERHLLWTRYFRPLLEQVIQYVDDRRTEDWQRDENRRPDVLPNTFGLQLWLLPFPWSPYLPGHVEQRTAFVAAVSSVIDELSARARPYDERFQQVKTAVFGLHRTDFVPIAVEMTSSYISDIEQLCLADWLRVELADHLLVAADKPKDEDQEACHEARLLLAVWQASAVEDLRVRGMRLVKSLSERKGTNAWFADHSSTT